MANPEATYEKETAASIEYRIDDDGELSRLEGLIEQAFSKAVPIVTEELDAKDIDVIFLSEPNRVIRELGVSGSSYHPNRAYVYIDPEHEKLMEEDLFATLLHEIHHCMRWRDPGLGKPLGEAIIFEGLACLYEAEHTGSAPIYASMSLSDEHIEKAMSSLNIENYNRAEWFFGNGSLECWFGYTLGYQLCKDYSKRTGKSAAQLVHTDAAEILGDANGAQLD